MGKTHCAVTRQNEQLRASRREEIGKWKIEDGKGQLTEKADPSPPFAKTATGFGMTATGGALVGEWNAQISLRVREALRAEMEEFAAQEKRKLGNVGTILLEWGMEQLKAAGSIDRLLKYKVPKFENRNSKIENGKSRPRS